jgi:Kef-type K+ transport system membrane component KefB/mannitol/fructose-specific phosphotransferase system IIA component (Ntr-type)
MTLAAATMSISELTVFFLGLGVLLGAARMLGELARKFNQPAVLGEILAGILLGPTLATTLFPELMTWMFPVGGPAAIAREGFTSLAVVLLLLVAGLEVDLSIVWRQGRSAVAVSMTGIFFPFVIGFGIAWFMPAVMGMDASSHKALPFALFFGIAMSITALPVIAKIMIDLNMFKSEMGSLIMSAAMVDDLLGWLGFAMVLAMLNDTGGSAVGKTIGMTLLFVLVMISVGRLVSHRLLPLIQAHLSWPGGVLGFVLVTALLCAAFTESIGIHAIFGSFIAGVIIGDSSHLRERTRDTIHQFVINIFAPVFFASVGLHLNFTAAFNPVLVLVVLVIAIVVKVGGCSLGARWAGMARNEALAIGFGMSARGAMEIVLGKLALQAGLITEELFVALVIMALVTSLMSGPCMQRLLRRQKDLTLPDLLSERYLLPNLEARTAREAIHELSARAADLLNQEVSSIYDAVWQREQMMSTGLEHGIAVPHARLAGLKKPVVLIGRSDRGVDFNAADGRPARIICLLLTPLNDQGAQIQLLSAVARTFHDDDTRRRVAEARSATEILAALNLARASEATAHA